jgi:hypothetical protein
LTAVKGKLPTDAERRIAQDRNPQYISSYSPNSDIHTASWRNKFQSLEFAIRVGADRSSCCWARLVGPYSMRYVAIDYQFGAYPAPSSYYYYCV